MRLLIRSLLPRPKPASRLHPGPGRWILNAFEVNNLSKKMTKTSGTTKRISLPRILLLIHHQIGPNPFRYSPKRTKIVVLAKKDLNDKAKARIPLSLASTLLLSGRTRTKIKTRRTFSTLSTTLVSRKTIKPTSASKRSQKTSVGFYDLHVGDWG